MNQILQLKTDGLTGDDLAFVKGLNAKFEEAKIASQPDIEKAINEVKAEFANVVTVEKFQNGIDEMKSLYADNNAALMAIKESGGKQTKDMSFDDKVDEALVKNIDKIASVQEGAPVFLFKEKTDKEKQATKAAATISTANLLPVAGNTIPFALVNTDPNVIKIVRRRPFLVDIVNTSTTDNTYASWIEQVNPDPGVAGMVTEGTAKPQTDFDLQERIAKVEKVAVWIAITKEALSDIKEMRRLINEELRTLVMLKLDQQILSGTGTTPELLGLLGAATPFSAAPFTNLINNANNFDVLRVAINQIEKANLYPTRILVHPSDFAAMELTKNANDSYIMPPFAAIEGMSIKGIPIIANTGIPEGTFVVGDFTKAYLKIREDFNLSVGYVNTDFLNNVLRILAEMRAVFYIPTNYRPAFVYGDFATAKSALEKP